jgi:cytochrome P450/NADPH-cytochrome P450 reductase
VLLCDLGRGVMPGIALCSEDEASVQHYRQEMLAKRRSLIDLLEEFPACELPLNVYLEQLPALRPRYYSISSSPLQDAHRCSITVAVVDAPARSGHGQYRGICSTYLQNMQEGEYIHAFVHDTRSSFMLPEKLTTPLIMVGPGTGLVPFRGFLQECAVQQVQSEQVGETLLFFGCRRPEQDFLYEDELRSLAQRGITELHVAFSRLSDQPKTYVQDLLWANRALLEQGAVVYVCGDAGAMAPAVRKAFANLYCEMTGQNEQQAEQWLTQLTDAGYYLVDVWPS